MDSFVDLLRQGQYRTAWLRFYRHRLFWPVAVLIALIIINVIHRASFVSLTMLNGHLYGSLIDILLHAAPLALVALGMTLVIATGGIDLSVGAVAAIAGAMACLHISKEADQNSGSGLVVALGLGVLVALGCGLWNGLLVAGLRIQPIIATLILMVAGRGVAQLITGGQIITINSTPYHAISGGFWLTLPIAIFIAATVLAVVGLVTRRTALGLIIESVGGNAEASRLAGIRSRRFILLVYVLCGLCAGIAGFMLTSDIQAADGNNAGLWIELDAILAVVIGGTPLTGGRFSIGGTVLGALIIQTLTTTVYALGVDPQTSLLFKAIVVIIVCLIQAPAFRARIAKATGFGRRRPPTTTESVSEGQKVEVAS